MISATNQQRSAYKDVEEVIEIENDTSTMTGDVIPFRKPSKKNIPNFIFKREQGLYSDSSFIQEISSVKKYMKPIGSSFKMVHDELGIFDCELVRGGLNGQSVVGLWRGDAFHAVMYQFIFNFSSRYCSISDDTPALVTSVDHMGPFFGNDGIIDMCPVMYNDQTCLLYVRNDKMGFSHAFLCKIINSDTIYSQKFTLPEKTLCCTGCHNGNVFAMGTDSGARVHTDENYIHIPMKKGDITSVEVDCDGDVLFCGLYTSDLIAVDLRDQFSSKIIPDSGTSSISETKLLSDGRTMILSRKDGTLSMIDLRTKGTIMNYPGNIASEKKLGLSCCEQNDLLCVTGADNYTRIWSLGVGRLLHEIRPKHETGNVQSAILSDGNRWAVAIFQKNEMCVVEPWN